MTWFKDAVIYQVHVRAFRDSNADGIGDFRGLTEKLDYLQSLGVTALWLLPFYPSPLKDDGYDIADYHDVNPMYGDLRDVREFVREAHRRGLRVITELVANHTSDQHPWFQRARRAKPGSTAREFYVWSDTNDRYRDARIIFKDFETSNWAWDPVANAYYWHRFYSHQPDLNFESPNVRKALLRALDFWFEMGVDGLRLDAVPYLYERDGTNCENLPETHGFLRELRRHVDTNYKDRMLLAEANQWPEDAVQYFGDGDECHMCFHFPLMPRMFMSMRMEDRFPIIDILAQTPPIPDNAQWALFLRNHDELTLEMVTDEERDHMYRAYAQDKEARINLGIRRRLAPLLNNNRRRIELMNALLFSMPGTPIIYYGDEIGMGDNIYLGDRNGVRTPMQWSGDRNAGFSEANRQRLYLPIILDPEYHYEAVNVEVQQANPQSLLGWMRRLIELRKRHPAFGRGDIEFLHPDNRKVLAFTRSFGDEKILIVANLSRFAQAAELDLRRYAGCTPVELFGRTEFPPIGGLPYFLTLGPHSFYWFAIETQRSAPHTIGLVDEPVLRITGDWRTALTSRRRDVERALVAFVRDRRWFASKSRTIRQLVIRQALPVGDSVLAVAEIDYADGDPETYLLPLGSAHGSVAALIRERTPRAVVARLEGGDAGAILYDALADRSFATALLDVIGRRARTRAGAVTLRADTTRAFEALRGSPDTPVEPSVAQVEQSNSSVVFGERLILKLFRRIDAGLNPDLEIGRALTETARFPHVPPLAGWLDIVTGKSSATAAVLQGYVPNEGDAWEWTLRALGDHLAGPAAAGEEHLAMARRIGERVAQLHLALASIDDAAFKPEPFTTFYMRGVYQTMRSTASQTFTQLRRALRGIEGAQRADAEAVLGREADVHAHLKRVLSRPVNAVRTRIHGDLHLGQLLVSGDDVVVIDFEGEPSRHVDDRRMKRSPLRDVAGMLRSYAYAAETGRRSAGDSADIAQRAERWCGDVSAAFLEAYWQTAADAPFVPAPPERDAFLDALVLEKALYEVAYELNNRPDWVGIPLRGILTHLPEPS